MTARQLILLTDPDDQRDDLPHCPHCGDPLEYAAEDSDELLECLCRLRACEWCGAPIRTEDAETHRGEESRGYYCSRACAEAGEIEWADRREGDVPDDRLSAADALDTVEWVNAFESV